MEQTTKSRENLFSLLLDSSLISPSNKREIDTKIVKCGDYIQVYKYKKHKIIDKDLEEIKKYEKKSTQIDLLYKIENYSRRNEEQIIEFKNIIRSRIQMERLVMTNEKQFKTFITLTFKDNLKSVEEANNKFDIWRTNIKRLKKDFKYVAVLEFQKRGAVHYHLLTNLDISKDFNIILPQKGKNGKNLKNRYDVKGWDYGFARVDKLNDIKVIGYLSKYMTKDIDNRLFGKRRYLYSRNLEKPIESYLNLDEQRHYDYLKHELELRELQYDKKYLDYFGDEVVFMEYKKNADNRSQHNI